MSLLFITKNIRKVLVKVLLKLPTFLVSLTNFLSFNRQLRDCHKQEGSDINETDICYALKDFHEIFGNHHSKPGKLLLTVLIIPPTPAHT